MVLVFVNLLNLCRYDHTSLLPSLYLSPCLVSLISCDTPSLFFYLSTFYFCLFYLSYIFHLCTIKSIIHSLTCFHWFLFTKSCCLKKIAGWWKYLIPPFSSEIVHLGTRLIFKKIFQINHPVIISFYALFSLTHSHFSIFWL